MKTFKAALENSPFYIITQYNGIEFKNLLENPDNVRILYIYDSDYLSYFSKDVEKWNSNYNYFVCWKGLEIAAIAKTKTNLDDLDDKVFELIYMEVVTKYQNEGIATLLTKEIFKHCNRFNYVFKTCSYTKIGEIKLKPLFNRLAEKMGLVFIDNENGDWIKKSFVY